MFRRIKTISDVVGRTFIQAIVLGFVLYVFEKVFSTNISFAFWLGGAMGFALWNLVLLAVRSVRERA